DQQDSYKVTGYGVLSGERYVYEADTREGYRHRTESTDCHADCVKMLQFASKDDPQHLDLHGVTIAEPPYHSFVVYGNEDTFTMDVRRYQQVGSWYCRRTVSSCTPAAPCGERSSTRTTMCSSSTIRTSPSRTPSCGRTRTVRSSNGDGRLGTSRTSP